MGGDSGFARPQMEHRTQEAERGEKREGGLGSGGGFDLNERTRSSGR